MEIINTATVDPKQFIQFLFRQGWLRQLIGDNSCACFVITRPLETKDFFEKLIDNITSIDSTTRDFIAFIVFYGETTVYARADKYGSFGYTEITQSGISFSRSRERCDEKIPGISFSQSQERCNETNYGTWFDNIYRQIFRTEPERINRRHFAQHMTRFADEIMDFYQIREDSIPCLVFVSSTNAKEHLVVKLSKDDPINYMYDVVLKTLSDSFRDLKNWLDIWQERKGYQTIYTSYEDAKGILEGFPATKEKIVQKIELTKKEIEKESLSLQMREQQQVELSKADLSILNEQIEEMDRQIKQKGSLGKLVLERCKLQKRRKKCEMRISSIEGAFPERVLNKALENLEWELRVCETVKHKAQNIIQTTPTNITEILADSIDKLNVATDKSLRLGYAWSELELKRGVNSFEVVKLVLKSTLETLPEVTKKQSSCGNALEEWLARKTFFEKELAITSSANQKFEYRKRIVECEEEINRIKRFMHSS